MDSIAKIGFAAFCAIGGFIIAFVIAARLGYHEKAHVMGAGLAAATLCALAAIKLSSVSASRTSSRWSKLLAAVAGAFIAISAVWFFFLAVGL